MSEYFEEDSYFRETFVSLIVTSDWIRSREFEDCTFEKCRFVDCHFFECAFLECVFEDCLLSNVTVAECSIIDTRFDDCKIVGVDWTQTINFRAVQFEKCGLDFCIFRGMKVKGLAISNCECKESDFQEADLTDGDFKGTDFEKCLFRRTNLTNANFVEAQNYWIDPRDNIVKRGKFSLPEAMSLLKSFDIVIADQ
jgi:fluoroquinolone resistance protein